MWNRIKQAVTVLIGRRQVILLNPPTMNLIQTLKTINQEKSYEDVVARAVYLLNDLDDKERQGAEVGYVLRGGAFHKIQVNPRHSAWS